MATIADLSGGTGGWTFDIVLIETVGDDTHNLKQAQTFEVIEGIWSVTSVILRLDRDFTAEGSPETGDLTLSIKEDSPTGSVLGTSAVERTDVLLTEAWQSFTFSGVTLSSGNTYCLVLECPYGIITFSEGVDRIEWVFRGNVPYSAGARYRYWDELGWDLDATRDCRAVVYGSPSAPGKPTTPSPAHQASNITLDESPLSWVDGGGTDTYEIYFREQGGAWELVGVAQAGVSYALTFGILNYNITYEWRVDATNAVGTTTGDTWNFGTLVFDPILPGASGGAGGDPGGENNMVTLRRLVAAANSKIFYEDI